MTERQKALTMVIQSVTDGWDEPLDEVRDIPPIVNAILASYWLVETVATEIEKAADDAVSIEVLEMGIRAWLRSRAEAIRAGGLK